MQILLETDRLVLRRFTDDDVDNLVDLDSDPAVMHFLNGGFPTPSDVVQCQILPRFLRSYERFDGYGFWAAIEKSTNEFVGWFGLHPQEGSDTSTVELGYRLRRPVWGKGYATEGARALIHKAFGELGARKVVATTYEHNLASRRVMEKAGMRLVRSYRPTLEELNATGTFVSTTQEVWDGSDVVYEVEKTAWVQRKESFPGS